ncbi:hypothetical protein JCM3765_004542 [Sporobolomyces pararoseus]
MRTATYKGWAALKIVQKSYSFSTNLNEKVIDQVRVLHDKYLFDEAAPLDTRQAEQWWKEEKWLSEVGRELMASEKRIETFEQFSTLKVSDCPFQKGSEAWWKDRAREAARESSTPKRKLELALVILPGVDYKVVRDFIAAGVKNVADIESKGKSTPSIDLYVKCKTISSIESQTIQAWLEKVQAITQSNLSGVHALFSENMKLQCGGSLSRSRKASSRADIFVFDKEWTIEKIRLWILLMFQQGTSFHASPPSLPRTRFKANVELDVLASIVSLFTFTQNDWQLGKENQIFDPEIACPQIFEGTTFCEAGISVEGKVYFATIAFVEEASRSSIMLYSHSSRTFMQALFQVGLQHNLILHPTGVYSFEEWKKGGVARRIEKEEEIFSLLGLEWHPPSTRNADFAEDQLSWGGGGIF